MTWRQLLGAVALAACGHPAPTPAPVDTAPAPKSAAPQRPEPAPAANPPPLAEAEKESPRRWGPPATPPADAMVTGSGMVWEILDGGDGTGDKPAAKDEVSYEYTEWDAPEGEQLDSADTTAILSTTDAGFQEAMMLMRAGQRARFWVPAALTARPVVVIRDIALKAVVDIPETPADVAAPPRAARSLGKGLRYVILARGTGKVTAGKADTVDVNYSGWTTDGKMFDSSVRRGQPASFKPTQVIPGWTMALQRMRAGDKWRVWIPEALAYKGQAGRPAGMLVFDIEVVSIEKAPAPPKTPRDVRRPPRGAKKTPGGVSFKFLGPRKPGGEQPDAESRVTVHYSGWTTDGKMFDSSITRGRPATFPLSGVIEGWREGMLEMRVGEKMRMWIPEELAYKGRAGVPQGMLVFDVELLEVE